MRGSTASCDAYDLLGVSPKATAAEIKSAWRAKSKVFHPDGGSAPDTEMMARVNDAYSRLSDPERRARYDADRRSQDAPEDGGPGAHDAAEPPPPSGGRPGWGDEPRASSPRWEPPPSGTTSPGTPPPATTPLATPATRWSHEEGWASVARLAEVVRDGHALPTQASPVVLNPGETYRCGVTAQLQRYTALDHVPFNATTFALGKSWGAILATAAASAVINARRRRNAERKAAPQWRRAGRVVLHVTDQRLVVVGDGDVESLWLGGGLTLFEPQFPLYGLTVQAEGGPPLFFQSPSVPYSAVVLHVLLRGHAPELG